MPNRKNYITKSTISFFVFRLGMSDESKCCRYSNNFQPIFWSIPDESTSELHRKGDINHVEVAWMTGCRDNNRSLGFFSSRSEIDIISFGYLLKRCEQCMKINGGIHRGLYRIIIGFDGLAGKPEVAFIAQALGIVLRSLHKLPNCCMWPLLLPKVYF